MKNRYWLHVTRYWLTDKDEIRNEKKRQKFRISHSEFRNLQSEIAGPMLFPRNALPSGPQAFFPVRKRSAKVGRATANLSLTKISKISSFIARERLLAFFLVLERRTSEKMNRPQEKKE